jgi:hypothetical protein
LRSGEWVAAGPEDAGLVLFAPVDSLFLEESVLLGSMSCLVSVDEVADETASKKWWYIGECALCSSATV